MRPKKLYLAVDLGAGSGRVLAGAFNGHTIKLKELNRFENRPVELPDGMHWNITSLYQNILDGLKLAADQYGDAVVSIGIDTWGVDYGLLDAQGRLLGLPYQYRDSRNDGMMQRAFEQVPQREIYAATGIQFLPFNTIYQLLAEATGRSPVLEQATDLLFIPDLLAYWLTGKKSQERSAASTSQLYNPQTRDWDYPLIKKLGLPQQLFRSICDPGDPLGPLSDAASRSTGLHGVQVVSVAGHDTGSAVAGVPSQAIVPAYLSSGTWSLMGLELTQPVLSEQSFQDGFTNEIGVNGTVRFLKNICGLWLIQESRRYWLDQGEDYPYAEMATLAHQAEPFRSLINPDAPCFASAGRMPEKIQQFCRETQQPIPETPGQIIRCIYESLALRYATVWRKLIQYTETPPTTLHIVGGGCQDKLLNQFTANALGVSVTAGPVEATGLGNILAQMLADGSIDSLAAGRQIVADSFPVQIYAPADAPLWQAAAKRFTPTTAR